MPRIFDNIELHLVKALEDTLPLSQRADFCVGYFNLRGWKLIDNLIEPWKGGEGSCCRLLVGMQPIPEEELHKELSLSTREDLLDQQTVLRLRKRMTEAFRQQLTFGAPTNADETGLRRLSNQIKAKKLIVKLSVRDSLHAKLYLLYRKDPNNPTVGFLGSSNLTMAGLSRQGELNVDVLDQDACNKLEKWFNDRWSDRWCLELSDELVDVIDNSWARQETISPYHIYLNIAYHLSQEARAGLAEFHIPRDFGNRLLDFQVAAVKIAAHHLNKRNGVIIGDVVGLGKTLMASALARIFQDDQLTETLIICPKNLVSMWQDYVERYRLIAKIIPYSKVINELPRLRRYRVVLIDESHNLRNREGKRYRAILEYVSQNDSKCILLSATPYNKSYLDLSSQLRLFVSEDQDLGVRPEMEIKEIGETEFIRQHQCPVRSLAAFEHSQHADDWRELMRLYLVRRTRKFIEDNYARTDATGRKFLTFENGSHFYFPTRIPLTVKFKMNDADPNDQYSKLYSDDVVNWINALNLPRYGLGNYLKPNPTVQPTPTEVAIIRSLSRAGKRLMGFSRTNLFKRLESGGPAFIQSVERHILRNHVFIYALKNDLPIPIGPQGAEYLDALSGEGDGDPDELELRDEEDDRRIEKKYQFRSKSISEPEFANRGKEVYSEYSSDLKARFRWIKASFFSAILLRQLEEDNKKLMQVLETCGIWDSKNDAKLIALKKLLQKDHPTEKVLIFTQFADTVDYLLSELRGAGMKSIEGVTGESDDPSAVAWRFSPESSGKHDFGTKDNEIRVLLSTDVLSEGQNLQDSFIVVNYDIPWAIIRLAQRAGRVDRIGQHSDRILCYSFMPADGIEKVIHLRTRVIQRLRENAQVLGTDEEFFEGDSSNKTIVDLYNEKAGILDEEDDNEVDLASKAYQIWKNAVERDPTLEKIIPNLPPVVYSTKQHLPTKSSPEGVLVYVRTADGNDALAWVDSDGRNVSESQTAILRAAECTPDTPGITRNPNHHELVRKAVQMMVEEEKSVGGQLGRPSSARFRTYERLKRYSEVTQGTLLESKDLLKAIDEIYRYPLKESAKDVLNRQLKTGINDEELSTLVLSLREDDRLCLVNEEDRREEPQLICSMGLFNQE